jgi:copper chaperone
METRTVHVPAISCHHCTATIQRELGEVAGVSGVEADVASKQVTVTWQPPATWRAILDLLDEIGYPAQEA